MTKQFEFCCSILFIQMKSDELKNKFLNALVNYHDGLVEFPFRAPLHDKRTFSKYLNPVSSDDSVDMDTRKEEIKIRNETSAFAIKTKY